jgi:hypothetical protein
VDEAAFEGCLAELRQHAGLAPLEGQQLEDAKLWAKGHGGYSVQAAAQFSRLVAE